mmetsp:Transcript_12017/g.18155  ORF Transcript_12017/g.18155 Transcript_12017/m.18155 type:complete len:305 (+) Transcript_12017:94-1008(+)
MDSPLVSIDTQHEDMIHDSQFDYYSKRVATCSSDRTIKIFDVSGDMYHNSATLRGHDGPVWQVAWAHPKFGVILASCSYDGTVIIHRETTSNNWSKVYHHKIHKSSVNSISWAPHEYGLILACASSDGRVSILEHKDDNWTCSAIQNDSLGCNSVSWAPFSALGSLLENGRSIKRLVTGSCDNMVRIWRQQEQGASWEEERTTLMHTDWVRDVAWAPNTGMPFNIIASCSEDRTVVIWKQTDKDGPWVPSLMKSFDSPVWRVSWSITGNVLVVSTGDHNVTLWKQSVDETWVQVTTIDDGADGM